MADDGPDPSDHDIELILQRATVQDWDSLWAAVNAVEREAEHLTWGGGQQVDTTLVDGVERPVFQMPYAVYSEATERMLQALYDIGAIVPFNWPDWHGVKTYRGGDRLDSAPVADAVRMTTAIIRADRFSEGTIGAMLNDGTLLAALRRIRRWKEAEEPQP